MRSARLIGWLIHGLVASVVVGWIALVSLYIRGALMWGHLPRGGLEDPQNVGDGLHYALVNYAVAGMVIGTLAIFVILAGLSAFERLGARSSKKLPFATAVSSVVAMYATPVFWWYLD